MTYYYPLQSNPALATSPSVKTLQVQTETLEISQVQVAEASDAQRRPMVKRALHPWRVMLFISNLTDKGGAEVQSIELARSLKSRGWDVSVVSMQAPKAGVQQLEAAGIPVRSLDAGSWNLFRPLLKLARMLREERPHILHCHMSKAVLTARLARLVQRIPVVIGTLHGLKMYNVRGTGWMLREAANRVTNWLSDITTAVCHAAGEHYVSTGAIPRQSMRVIPNGVDTDRFRFDASARLRMRTELSVGNEFVWLMIGRFQPVKDHHTMIRAFARVCSESPRATLLFAGDGPLREELAELARGMGIGSRVKFLGPRSDVRDLMNAADGLVLSSIYEAMPMVLLEAAACRLPCVATDVGGTSDVLIHGLTGFLTPPSNPEALASAMLRLSSMPVNARTQMGEQARRHVTSRFAMEEVTGQWESLYTELLAKKEVCL